MRRILALNLPRFSVERLGHRATLTLLVGNTQGAQWIAERSDRAAELGVQPGMSLAHARALIGSGSSTPEEPTIVPFDPEADRRALEELAEWAMRFSPTVAVAPPDALLLDVTGSERLFGAEKTLMTAALRALALRGLRARAAVASTVGCAFALARYGGSGRALVPPVAPGAESAALAPLPVEALRLEPAALEALHEVGLERIEHLDALPRSGLPARFGADLLLRLDQARGAAFEPLAPLRPAALLEAVHEFESPVELEVVLFVLRGLLGRLTEELKQRGEGTRRVEVEFACAEAPPFTTAIALSRPNRDLAHLWTMLEPRVERAQLGFGVLCISVAMPGTAPMPALQNAHWSPADAGDKVIHAHRGALGELLDTLAGRLGEEHVLGIEAVESHLPERAFRTHSITGRAHSGEVGAAITPLARPSRLFAPPHPVAVDLAGGDHPVRFRWRGEVRHVTHCFGPERIESPWWSRPDVGRATGTRDYFRVAESGGHWLWLGTEGGRWFVHGVW